MKSGFTLIELLVAISIIAVLSTIGLFAFSSVQKSARDSVRKGDLRTLATALEIYYQKNNTYPIPAPIVSNNNTAWSDQTTTTWSALATALVPTFIDHVPNDPINGGSCCGSNWYIYAYIILKGGQAFRLCANLENKNDNDINVSPANSCAPATSPFFGIYKVDSP